MPRKPPPDPLSELAGVASCAECGSIVRDYGWGIADPGPFFVEAIAEAVGPEWELKQGYGIGRGMPHADACPPIRPGELVGLVVDVMEARPSDVDRARAAIRRRSARRKQPIITKARTA